MSAVPLLIALALSAAPAKIAVTPLAGENIDDDTLEELSRKLASALEKEGFTVTPPQTTTAALGSEKFADARAPELARALAVDMVAAGGIGKAGKEYQVDIRVLSGTDAQTIALHSRKVRSLAGVSAELKRAARAVSTIVLKTPEGPILTTEPDEPSASLRRYAWAPALGGIVLAGAGTYFLLQTQDAADELKNRRLDGTRALRVADYGQQNESLAWTSFLLAAGAAGGAAAMYFLSPPEEDEGGAMSVSLAASPNGAFAALRWELP